MDRNRKYPTVRDPIMRGQMVSYYRLTSVVSKAFELCYTHIEWERSAGLGFSDQIWQQLYYSNLTPSLHPLTDIYIHTYTHSYNDHCHKGGHLFRPLLQMADSFWRLVCLFVATLSCSLASGHLELILDSFLFNLSWWLKNTSWI